MKKYSPSVNGFYDTTVNKNIPNDAIEISDDEYNALFQAQAAGKRITAVDGQPVAVDNVIVNDALKTRLLESAVSRHLDSVAQSLGYDSLHIAITYADEPSVPKYQAEGQALRAWRSQVWSEFYQILDDNLDTPAADVIALLPEFTPPAV